jgi:type VII secretion-associated protein (TIGR03931 family)
MNPSDVIHLTQSWAPRVQTLDAAAETLRTALAEQPEGVFVDFTARGERAQRRAVTYAEIRAERRIDWTVLLDGGVRIAIGCEGSPTACDRAVGSARAVTRK